MGHGCESLHDAPLEIRLMRLKSRTSVAPAFLLNSLPAVGVLRDVRFIRDSARKNIALWTDLPKITISNIHTQYGLLWAVFCYLEKRSV